MACHSCNSKKGTKNIRDFMVQRTRDFKSSVMGNLQFYDYEFVAPTIQLTVPPNDDMVVIIEGSPS
jgi:hypothetical protein